MSTPVRLALCLDGAFYTVLLGENDSPAVTAGRIARRLDRAYTVEITPEDRDRVTVRFVAS